MSSANGFQIRLEILKLALTSIVEEHNIIHKYEELVRSEEEKHLSDNDPFADVDSEFYDEDGIDDLEETNTPQEDETSFVDEILARAAKFNSFVSNITQ